MVPRFDPFAGVRYAIEKLDDVAATIRRAIQTR